jgi:aspartyl-tRNA synthetase
LRENKNDPNELAFAFIVDFPMFEWKESEKRWDAVHHPFVKIKRNGMTKEELLEKIEKDPQSLFAFQYDFVCNGYEIGGGSLRETDIDVLVKVFEKMGNKLEDIYRKFGHLIEAFKFGVPPHGGIAPGIDRLLMVLLNEPSIREVIAFPKTGEAQDLMMQSPDYVEEEKLKELKIKILD